MLFHHCMKMKIILLFNSYVNGYLKKLQYCFVTGLHYNSSKQSFCIIIRTQIPADDTNCSLEQTRNTLLKDMSNKFSSRNDQNGL